jgi:hypothetical protein
MGWSSGTRLASRLIKTIKKNVPDYQARKVIYLEMIDAFEDADWDGAFECLKIDRAFDAALKKKHPSWFMEN